MPAKLRLNPQAKLAMAELQEPGQPDLFKHLVNVFVETSDEYIKSLLGFAKNRQILAMKDVAHSWKSSCAAIGAEILTDLCLQVETLGFPFNEREFGLLIGKLELEYKTTRVELLKSIGAEIKSEDAA